MVNKELIIKLYKENKSISAIAREAGCSRIRVYQILDKAGFIEQTETRYVKLGKLTNLENLLLDFKDKYANKETRLVADKLLKEVGRLIRGMR